VIVIACVLLAAVIFAFLLDLIKVPTFRRLQIAEPKPEAKAEPTPDAKAEPTPEAKVEPKPEAKVEPKPEAKTEPTPETTTPSDLTPQLVKRVHELYEELGREEVRAVEKLEKAEGEIPKNATNK
jgi:outer membrane biosynthesis protein TonB